MALPKSMTVLHELVGTRHDVPVVLGAPSSAPALRPRITALLALIAFLQACSPSTPSEYMFSGPTMGTTFTVKVIVEVSGEALSAMRQAEARTTIEQKLEEVNQKMSTYLASSELSRFNQFRGTEAFPVSPETLAVFAEAQRISAATDGVFDITVGPLVNLWGFGPDPPPKDLPSEKELDRLRAQIGWGKIEVDTANSALRKSHPEIYCDLSAIAKGYAVDRVAEALSEMGFSRYMVEVGGEVRTMGRNAADEPWRIAIERPQAGERAFQRVVPLSGMAMATSGDYRNFFEKDGLRWSHEIDPRTGRPAQHRLASVSVIDQQCMRADGYATALMVFGEDAGYAWAAENSVPALFLVRNGASFEEKATPAFEALFPDLTAERRESN